MPTLPTSVRKSSRLPAKRPGPEGGPRDRNRRANLQRLCDAGLELFLSEGTAAVTIDQIVTRAGMAKGNFYRYVADKAELVASIMEPVTTDVTAALDHCGHALRRARPDQIASIYLALATDLSTAVARHSSRVLLYLQEARAPAGSTRGAIHALADQLTAKAIALTEIARDHGLIRDVDPRISALSVVGSVEAILFTYLRGHVLTGPVPKVISELVEIILRGIRT